MTDLRKRDRTTVEFSEREKKKLEKLTSMIDQNQSEVIRKAISLYYYIGKEVLKGKSIFIADADENTEIALIEFKS